MYGEKNWKITRVGAIATVLLTASFIYLILSESGFNLSLVLAVLSGLLYGLSTTISSIDRFKSISRPLSGFLSMGSGLLLLGGFILMGTNLGQFFSNLEGGLLSMIKSILASIIGLIGLIIGMYFSVKGITLVSSEKIDSKKPVGPDRADFLFGVILAGISAISIFGTAFIRDIPISRIYRDITEIAIAEGGFSGLITAILVILAYFSVRKAWRTLPIKESIPSEHLETYSSVSKMQKILSWIIIPLFFIVLIFTDIRDIRSLKWIDHLKSSGFRILLSYTFISSIITFTSVKLLQAVTGERKAIKSLAPYFIFGLLAWLVAPLFTPFVDTLISPIPELLRPSVKSVKGALGERNFVLVIMTAASGLSFLLKSFIGSLRAFGFIPSGLEGTTLSATGIFLSSIGMYLYHSSPSSTLLFAGIALSTVVWEVGKRSTVLGMEVGRGANTAQAETVRVISKLLIGLFSILTASILFLSVGRVKLDVGAVSGLVFLLAATGVTLILFSLKDHT